MASRQVEEIRIPVPWGHVAGKWWGPKDIRPILALHGREDNAGSFDRLIPMLPDHLSYLALDLPGHGESSYIGPGEIYSVYHLMNTFNLILELFQWDKVSLMSHSLSSITCYLLMPCINEKIDLYITLDGLKPHIWTGDIQINQYKTNLQSWIIAEKRNAEIVEPPSYPYDELVQKYINAAQPSVTKESADPIVRRGVKASKLHPGKYYFSRDRRAKSIFFPELSQDNAIHIAKILKFPFCMIRATQTLRPLVGQMSYWDEIITIMKNQNPTFEYHYIEGDHFLHLSEPHKISHILCDFINRVRRPSIATESKL